MEKKDMQKFMQKAKKEVEVTYKWEMPKKEGEMCDCNAHTKKSMQYKE